MIVGALAVVRCVAGLNGRRYALFTVSVVLEINGRVYYNVALSHIVSISRVFH